MAQVRLEVPEIQCLTESKAVLILVLLGARHLGQLLAATTAGATPAGPTECHKIELGSLPGPT